MSAYNDEADVYLNANADEKALVKQAEALAFLLGGLAALSPNERKQVLDAAIAFYRVER